MSQYVGLAATKEAIGLSGAASDTVDDGVLLSLIFRASAIVDGHLEAIRPGYVGFASSCNSRTSIGSGTRVYDGTGTDTLFIDDAQTVSGVSVDTVSISSDSWRLWPYNGVPKRALVYALPTSSIRGLTVAIWTRGTANVGVTGYHGLDHVPADVEQVTLGVVIVLWRRYQGGHDVADTKFVRTTGQTATVVADPEIAGILSSLDARWGVPGVWGAGGVW